MRSAFETLLEDFTTYPNKIVLLKSKQDTLPFLVGEVVSGALGGTVLIGLQEKTTLAVPLGGL